MSKVTTKLKALRAIANGPKVGDGVLNKCISDAADLIETLKRINDTLEKESMAFRAILDQPFTFHPDSDPMFISGMNTAMRLFEDIYLGKPQEALNLYALEQRLQNTVEILDLGKRYTNGGTEKWVIDDEKVKKHVNHLHDKFKKAECLNTKP